MILRLLNIQGIAGIAVGLALAIMLVVQKGQTRHWRKQSAQFEQLYSAERAAFAGTVATYRAAADQARAAGQANAARVAASQEAISERTAHDYQARLADARARARRLRVEAASAAADPGAGRAAPLPGLAAAPRGAPEGAGKDRFPLSDRELATEQAIQLDELIKWVRAQAKVDNSPAAVATSGKD